MTENEGIGAIARGVDVSYWQQNVNWSQVASDNVQFAMLATRFRGNVDPFFAMNAANASQAGLRLGAYIYSYATSVEMAQQEADFVLILSRIILSPFRLSLMPRMLIRWNSDAVSGQRCDQRVL